MLKETKRSKTKGVEEKREYQQSDFLRGTREINLETFRTAVNEWKNKRGYKFGVRGKEKKKLLGEWGAS